MVLNNATMTRIDWEVDELDVLLTVFDLYVGTFNTGAPALNAGQQGFAFGTRWIGFENDQLSFKWTAVGAIAGSVFHGGIAACGVMPNGVP